MSHLQQGDRARNGNHRSEAPRPETRKLFCRSASVLGRPRPTEATGLMHATLFPGDALRQIVLVYSRVGSVRRGRPRTVPLFLHSEAIFLYMPREDPAGIRMRHAHFGGSYVSK